MCTIYACHIRMLMLEGIQAGLAARTADLWLEACRQKRLASCEDQRCQANRLLLSYVARGQRIRILCA